MLLEEKLIVKYALNYVKDLIFNINHGKIYPNYITEEVDQVSPLLSIHNSLNLFILSLEVIHYKSLITLLKNIQLLIILGN